MTPLKNPNAPVNTTPPIIGAISSKARIEVVMVKAPQALVLNALLAVDESKRRRRPNGNWNIARLFRLNSRGYELTRRNENNENGELNATLQKGNMRDVDDSAALVEWPMAVYLRSQQSCHIPLTTI